ncbi:MAG: AAA family ATPase [Deltaproteobacteria bacterium]|nr:AAA family ATPase [Deltaproteobacteria bacterium]
MPSTSDLPARFVRWQAIQLVRESRARLIEAGAGPDVNVELAALFVDLPVEGSRETIVRTLASSRVLRLVRSIDEAGTLREATEPVDHDGRLTLLLGAPGSGKTTVSTILTQLLRSDLIREDSLEEPLRVAASPVLAGLAALRDRLSIPAPVAATPVRVNLPELSDFLRRDSAPDGVWRFLSYSASNTTLPTLAPEPAPLSPTELRALLVSQKRVFWVFDGLDEVENLEDRNQLVSELRSAIGQTRGPHVLITSRPEGYRGELGECDQLTLGPLSKDQAQAHAERLMATWGKLAEMAPVLKRELAKPAVAELLRTPLAVTLATLMVAQEGELPSSRFKLFNRFFEITFSREVQKSLRDGITRGDERRLRALHVRAGLALHVRSAASSSRARLSLRDFRQMIRDLLDEEGETDDVEGWVARLSRFTSERLVLLQCPTPRSIAFGLRSIQEFFAAEALLECPVDFGELFREIGGSSHWRNVLGFVASRAVEQTQGSRQAIAHALERTCRDLDEGHRGLGPKVARLGAELALYLLEETHAYAPPAVLTGWSEIVASAANAGSLVSPEFEYRLGRLAARSRYQNQYLELVEQRLSRDSTDRSAWRILHGLAENALEAAAAVAGRFLDSQRAASSAAKSMQELQYPFAPWMWTSFDEHLEWFSPLALLKHSWRGDDDANSSSLTRRALQFPRVRNVRVESSDTPFCASLGTLGGADSAWHELLALRSPESGPWRAWRATAEFETHPSTENLAKALEVFAEPTAFRERWLFSCSFVMSTCLTAARRPQDFREMANQAREGQLGDPDVWRRAQDRWLSSGFSQEDLVHTLTTPWGLDPDLGARGAPFWMLRPADYEALKSNEEGARRLADAILSSGCTVGPHVGSLSAVLSWASLPIEAQRNLGILDECPFPDLSGPDSAVWFQWLDQRGQTAQEARRARFYKAAGGTLPGDQLIDELNASPQRVGLLTYLAPLIAGDADLGRLTIPPLAVDAPGHLKSIHAAFSILVNRPVGDRLDELIGQLRQSDSDEGLSVIFAVIERRPNPLPGDAELLARILESLAPSDNRTSGLVTLSQVIDRLQPAAFADEASWAKHQLPGRFPDLRDAEAVPPRIIELSELSQVGPFVETPAVSDPFPLSDPAIGQWVIIVGENGTGKTTLLRALTLALLPPKRAEKLIDERVSLLRNGAEARVQLRLNLGKVGFVLRREGREFALESIVSDRIHDDELPWVAAYGVRRGTARGEPDRSPALRDPLAEVLSLFERPTSLVAAVEWLKDLDYQAIKEQETPSASGNPGTRRAIWNAVEQALCKLLQLERIEATGGNIFVHHRAFGRLPLERLSDGYLTTAGWVVDLIARWVDGRRDLDEPVPPNLLETMTGLVLIDEIDLHLHPVWQLNIIGDLRRLFPRLSFIVTTHNPLTLQGAKPGEVFVLRRNSNAIELVQKDIQPGMDVDWALFELFGLESTFDADTRELLATHRQMVRDGLEREDPKRVPVEEALRERLGKFGDTVTAMSDASTRRLSPEEGKKLSEILRSSKKPKK